VSTPHNIREDKVRLSVLEFRNNVLTCKSTYLICLVSLTVYRKVLTFRVKEPEWKHKIIVLDRKSQWVLEATKRTLRV
jgi:hypothetical protein